MPQIHNNILCITHEEITSVVSVANYKWLVHAKSINPIRRGCYGTPALIEYVSLPTRIKEAYVSKYGDPTDKSKNYTLKGLISIDYKAEDFYARHELADGRKLKPEYQREYTINASVLRAIGHLLNDRSALRKALGGSTTKLFSKIVEATNAIKDEYKHTLPDCDKRLKDKLKEFQKKGYKCLISGKFLNKNSKKVDDAQKEALLRKLISDHRNLDGEQIASLYNLVAENLQWEKISASTVLNYKTKWDLVSYGQKHGETSFNNAKAMLVKRSAPTYPLYFWTMDGWDAELLYQKTENDKKGHSVTTYHNRLTVVVVLDASIKYPVGYAIGTHETPALIKEALRNALKHTKELFGSYYKPNQLQTDRYGKGTLTSFYEAATDKYTPARAKNAKAKVIEPYFKQINKDYCQFLPNWSGFSITTDKDNQPNSEFLNKNKHSFPDELGLIKQIEAIIFKERQTKFDQYVDLFNQMPAEDKLIMSDEDYLFYMGETTGYTNRLESMGLHPTIGGVKRLYDSFDFSFRQLSHIDWKVCYDPDDTKQVLAVSEDGTRRFMLEEKYIQPMALIERKEGDAEELTRINQFNKAVKAEIIETIIEDNKLVGELFENNPRLNETLTKHLLTDSDGQHKNQRNANRLAGATKLLAKQNKQEEKVKELSWKEEQDEYLDSKVDVSKYI